MFSGKMQKVKKFSFFNFICMSKRFFSGTKYFILGAISFFALINLIDFLESFAIDCNGNVFPCALLVDLLTYISVFIFLVGTFKLILFFWKDYKIIEKIKKIKRQYLGGEKKQEQKIEGECEMCGTINDKDAVFCKKCAGSLNPEEESK